MARRASPSRATLLTLFGVLLIAGLAMIAYIGGMVYKHATFTDRIASRLDSFNCSDGNAYTDPRYQFCTLTFTLRNDNDFEVSLNLNGIDGPGFAETGMSRVIAEYDDGSRHPLFIGHMENPSRLAPRQSAEFKAVFSMPKEKKVTSLFLINHTIVMNN